MLEDKVAIVTGGGQGVGLGIATALAASGARVLITGRDLAKLEVAAGEIGAAVVVPDAVAVHSADVRKREDAVATAKRAMELFGRIDILVNNAQISAPGKLLEDLDDATFDATLESGLYGTFYHMQAVLPYMREKGGSIINLGSREGVVGGIGFGCYAATKEAVRGISRVAAREWGRYGVRVNVINPAALSPAATTYLENNPDEAARYLKEIALGRFGDPLGDIGPIAVFLASDASHYVTGQTINVDGGQVMG